MRRNRVWFSNGDERNNTKKRKRERESVGGRTRWSREAQWQRAAEDGSEPMTMVEWNTFKRRRKSREKERKK
ncbi:hypothetical protein PIB30_095619, partial [Stylosanthes scabra]|nr:hypothetical protein [Stylosanthes scabra]